MFNGRSKRRKSLSELEQAVMDTVWANPNSTAEACREALEPARKLKDSTVRTILRRLEEKGYLTHEVSGRTYVYRASDQPQNVAAQAVRQIIDRLCGGSVEELLVGMVDSEVLNPDELQTLARKIAARKEAEK
jgi:predicted transcriptional regulator